MKRLPHWQDLLAAHFAQAATQRFAWGKFDCALAACDGVQAICGVDPGARYRGTYSTEKEALAVIGSDIGVFAAASGTALGFPEHPRPAFARRGDVVLLDNSVRGGPATRALGTVDLTGLFARCPGHRRGLVRIPMRLWLRAWKIG